MGDVIIDHADGLGKGVRDYRTAEIEAALLQVAGKRLAHFALGRNLSPLLEMIVHRLACHMLPDEIAEAARLLFDLQPSFGAPDRGLDLGAASDDAFILEQPVDVARAVLGDAVRVEAVKGFAEILALAQNGDPGKPGLETVQHQLLIQRAAVIFGHAPFLIVIGDVKRVFAGPGAALFLFHGSNHLGLNAVTAMLSAVNGAFASSRRSRRIKAKPAES